MDRIAAVAALVGRGEWTTYGEIARVALGGRGARLVGGSAARGAIGNAHRVLLAGGRISPGWGGGRIDECRRRLEAEGISFRNGRADPARHLTWLDLAARFEGGRPSAGSAEHRPTGETSPLRQSRATLRG